MTSGGFGLTIGKKFSPSWLRIWAKGLELILLKLMGNLKDNGQVVGIKAHNINEIVKIIIGSAGVMTGEAAIVSSVITSSAASFATDSVYMAMAVVLWSSAICEVSILLPKNGTIAVVIVGSAARAGLSDIVSSSEVPWPSFFFGEVHLLFEKDTDYSAEQEMKLSETSLELVVYTEQQSDLMTLLTQPLKACHLHQVYNTLKRVGREVVLRFLDSLMAVVLASHSEYTSRAIYTLDTILEAIPWNSPDFLIKS
ncbi:hypothetical protein AKJ16_DCAP03043, partial [Drosera capensis]